MPLNILESNMISRKEAQAKLLRKYNTGKPCRNGHLSDRYTSTGMCCECNKMHVAASNAKYKFNKNMQTRTVVYNDVPIDVINELDAFLAALKLRAEMARQARLERPNLSALGGNILTAMPR